MEIQSIKALLDVIQVTLKRGETAQTVSVIPSLLTLPKGEDSKGTSLRGYVKITFVSQQKDCFKVGYVVDNVKHVIEISNETYRQRGSIFIAKEQAALKEAFENRKTNSILYRRKLVDVCEPTVWNIRFFENRVEELITGFRINSNAGSKRKKWVIDENGQIATGYEIVPQQEIKKELRYVKLLHKATVKRVPRFSLGDDSSTSYENWEIEGEEFWDEGEMADGWKAIVKKHHDLLKEEVGRAVEKQGKKLTQEEAELLQKTHQTFEVSFGGNIVRILAMSKIIAKHAKSDEKIQRILFDLWDEKKDTYKDEKNVKTFKSNLLKEIEAVINLNR